MSRSQRLADEADGVGGVLAAEGGMNTREVEEFYCTNTPMSAPSKKKLGFSHLSAYR